MVALAPVDSEKQHLGLLGSDVLSMSWRRTCGALLAVLTWHDIHQPSALLDHRPGHGLPKSSRAPKPPSAHRLMAPP
jgi:hypothetical protein